ncbi:MAG: zinc-dependent alcohol dehydrogenase family protein [Rhodothalassiaceae bacterium]
MRAMVFAAPGQPLRLVRRPVPECGPGEILVRVSACGVCRTDLHLVAGELPDPRPHVVPGHEVVGRVAAVGESVTGFRTGDRVGVPWLGWTCGTCAFCRRGEENLCPEARFTGYTRDGGYADYICADARYAFPLPDAYDDLHAAPLLCAGLIGFRAYRMAGDARTIGLYGFGAAAHILCQLAVAEGREVYAFTKPGDKAAQRFARARGAVWAGGSNEPPPGPLDAALLFAPVGALVPRALAAVRPGGRVIAAGIHMSDIPSFPYHLLWQERVLRSVANLTRADGRDFLARAGAAPITTTVHPYPLEEANRALDDLRAGRFEGAAVLVVNPGD